MPQNNKIKSTAWDLSTEPANAAALIYTTFPSLHEAEVTGLALVEQSLAACVNVLPGMVSIYRWEGQIHRDQEVAMLIKTRQSLVEAVTREIRARHAYSNPAVLAVPVAGGSGAYLDWIFAQTMTDAASHGTE